MAHLTQQAIDAAIEREQDNEHRSHLGASVIGRECPREVWYIFRWAATPRFEARKLRIFDRGKRSERDIFIAWLRAAGLQVEDEDPTTGKQFRVQWAEGHAAGSLDALLHRVPDFPGAWLLGEFKTHNEKSWKRTAKNGVAREHWEHYVQMQIYMLHTQLPAALYFALNKNDDSLYVELVPFCREDAERYADRATAIVHAPVPPDRLSETPAFFKCRMCDMLPICHNGIPLERNCRTCVYSLPTAGATWTCRRYNYVLSKEEQLRGCTGYAPIAQ